MTSAFIEWTQGLIRGGENCFEFGAPYTFVLSVIRQGDEAYLYGLCMKDKTRFTSKEWDAIKAILIGHNFKTARWERKNNGSREVVYHL